MNARSPRIHFIDFGRAVCNSSEAFRREWLVTNGIGGYASGTIGGVRTRRYHGKLVAATNPPAGRTMLLAEALPTAIYRGTHYPLGANQWKDGSISPHGHFWLQRFHVDRLIPVWRWSFSDALLERRVFMIQGENTICEHWTLVQGSSPIQLQIEILADCRCHHQLGRLDAQPPALERASRGVRLSWNGTNPSDPRALQEPQELFVQCDKSVPSPTGVWWKDFLLSQERARGYDSIDCLWHAASLEVVLTPGTSTLFTASTALQPSRDADATLANELTRLDGLLATARIPEGFPVIQQLVLAADQFIVARKRKDPKASPGVSIIAGYPWFADWGRDAMISLPGLLLATGRVDLAKTLLDTYAEQLDRGMLPNRFPERVGDEIEYNSVDAPLLMIIAAGHTFAASNDRKWLLQIWPKLQSIVTEFTKGTRHGIGVDPADGLLRAGEDGIQLTWMDAKVGSHVITPRQGKPIEINAFWIYALTAMAQMAESIGASADDYVSAAKRARASFGKFWNHDASCCFDVIDGPTGSDCSVRPNQLFASADSGSGTILDAVGAPPLLPAGQCKAVIDLCMSRLWTPQGIRTLDPRDSAYHATYSGDTQSRDGAYHQGTAWPWLFAAMVRSHNHVYKDRKVLDDFLFPFSNHLREAGLGSVSEVFSGDPPHEPGGCPAQAWSVATLLELLRWSAPKENPTESNTAPACATPSNQR